MSSSISIPGRSLGFKHDHRWTRLWSGGGAQDLHRWMYGWHIHIHGDCSREWKDRNSYTVTSRENSSDPGAIVIVKTHISSLSAAMTQAMGIVSSLRTMHLGTRAK